MVPLPPQCARHHIMNPGRVLDGCRLPDIGAPTPLILHPSADSCAIVVKTNILPLKKKKPIWAGVLWKKFQAVQR